MNLVKFNEVFVGTIFSSSLSIFYTSTALYINKRYCYLLRIVDVQYVTRYISMHV